MALDHAMLTVHEDKPEGDALWHDLDAAQGELLVCIQRLAGTAATNAGELKAKAAVLAAMMRMPGADAIAPADEVRALALSVAEDVTRLL